MTDQDVTPYLGVSKRRDSTQWQWAIVVPQDLKDHFRGAKFAHRCSLRTSDLREANRQAAMLRAEWERNFEATRRARDAKPSPITPELAQAVADELTRWVLQADDNARDFPEFAQALAKQRGRADAAKLQDTPEGQRLAEVLPPSTFSSLVIGNAPREEAGAPPRDPLEGLKPEEREALAAWNTEGLKTAATWTAGRNLRGVQEWADRVARSLGHVVDWNGPGAREALTLCLESLRKASEATTGRDKGQPIPTPSASPTAPPVPPSTAVRGHTVMEAYEVWAAEKPNRPAKTFKTYHTAALKLHGLLQGRSLESLTREDGRNISAALKGEAAERGPRAMNTAATQLSRFRTLIAQAVEEQWIDRNPLDGRGRDIERVRGIRDEWSSDQLSALFGLPLFTSYALPTTGRAGRDAAYWLPLLGLYTGARVSELAQLMTDDVCLESGLWCLHLRHDPTQGLRTKSKESRRVPIHSELIRLGFLEYVAVIRSRGSAHLWPALPRSKDNGAGGPFSSWFGRLNRGVGLPDAVTFHSFRHTMETRLRVLGVPQPHIDAITGHAPKEGSKVSGSYAHPKPPDVAPSLERLCFPALKLGKVYTTPAWRP